MVIKIKKRPLIDKSREWNSFVKCNGITGNRGINRIKAKLCGILQFDFQIK